ncbi:T9SS type A sorting domain-containing protein [candidate division KSB1 bacterium]|nr:T9SS type A sorting domain-containing protein [candidate division KSB1 bacterium]
MKNKAVLVVFTLLVGSIGFNVGIAQAEGSSTGSGESIKCTGGCVSGYFSINGEVPDKTKMILVNQVTSETFYDVVNGETGFYKFHGIPLGTYWLYPENYENLKVQRDVVELSDTRCVLANFRLTEGCYPVYSGYHVNNFNLFQPAELPIIGTYANGRDVNVLKYYALLADRMNIDAVKIKLDDLMFSACGNDCYNAYKNSLIKQILDLQQEIRDEHPEFQLKTIAVLDLRLGSLDENIQLLHLLGDSILTHPSYEGVAEKKKLPFFLISDPVLYNSTDFEEIDELAKNLRITLNDHIPQKLLVALDLNPANSSLAKIRYLMHYVDTLYPRVDLSDNSDTPWTATSGNEIGLDYLKNFYNNEKNLNLPVLGGNVWVGFDDRNTYGNHQTGDGQPTYISKRFQNNQFLTSDEIWELAYGRSPYVLVLETLNNWENTTAFAPSVDFGNALTMDQWVKINKWKKNKCFFWQVNELALDFLNAWYKAASAGHHSETTLKLAEQLFFQKQYQEAIDLVQPVDVVYDYALGFDGVDDYATVPNNENLNVTENFTIELWLKSDVSNKAWAQILEKGFYDEYSLGFYGSTGKVVGALSTQEDGNYKFKNILGPSTTALQPGQWHHVAATYDGENARLYIDGVLESEKPVHAVARRLNGDLILGATKKPNGQVKLNYTGLLYDLRIWNYARTNEQITTAMLQELTGNEPGLVCYLPLNEDSGQILQEKTAQSADGWLGSNLTDETVDPAHVPSDMPGISGNNTIDFNLNQSTDDLTSVAKPEKLMLEQNYPNPFNPVTAISYALDRDTDVTLKVYDLNGREVATLVKATQNAGYYSINWEAGRLSSGTYFYRLNTNETVMTRKMILLK